MFDWRIASIVMLVSVGFLCGVSILDAAEEFAVRMGLAHPADAGWGAPVEFPSNHEPTSVTP